MDGGPTDCIPIPMAHLLAPMNISRLWWTFYADAEAQEEAYTYYARDKGAAEWSWDGIATPEPNDPANVLPREVSNEY
jgi:hypothetical protein